jgi:hypothetical protein
MGTVPPSVCQRTACDGDGGLTSVPDPNAVSTQPAPACMRNACSTALYLHVSIARVQRLTSPLDRLPAMPTQPSSAAVPTP